MRLQLEKESMVDISELRGELDVYYAIMKDFQTGDPRENLMHLSSFTARMSEARGQIIRNTGGKVEDNFRTKELDPFISECDRQFKIWSRLITYAQFDWETSRG
jgi:hypothetical protein